MKKILISACLLGDKVKYNGKGNYCPLVEKLKQQYDLVLFCPEVEGGLPIPRNPSEIKNDEVFMNKYYDPTPVPKESELDPEEFQTRLESWYKMY